MEKEDINEIRKKLKLNLKIKPECCKWCDFKPNASSHDWNHKRKLEKAVVKYYTKKKANSI